MENNQTTKNISPITHSEIGSYHWFMSNISHIKSVAEAAQKDDFPFEQYRKDYGERVYGRIIEMMNWFTTTRPDKLPPSTPTEEPTIVTDNSKVIANMQAEIDRLTAEKNASVDGDLVQQLWKMMAKYDTDAAWSSGDGFAQADNRRREFAQSIAAIVSREIEQERKKAAFEFAGWIRATDLRFELCGWTVDDKDFYTDEEIYTLFNNHLKRVSLTQQ